MKAKLILIFLILSILCINLTARYYNPKIGRFITADSVTPGSGANLQGLNRYSYCSNNPVKYIDPKGHQPASTTTQPTSLFLGNLYIPKNTAAVAPKVNPISKSFFGSGGAGSLILGMLWDINIRLASQTVSLDAYNKFLYQPNVMSHQYEYPDYSSSKNENSMEKDTSYSNNYSIAYLPGGFGKGGDSFAAMATAKYFACIFDTVKIVDNFETSLSFRPETIEEIHEKFVLPFLQMLNTSNVVMVKADWRLYASTVSNSNSGVYFVAPLFSYWIMEGDKNLRIRPLYGQNVYSDIEFSELEKDGWIYTKKPRNEVANQEGVQSNYFTRDVHTYKK